MKYRNTRTGAILDTTAEIRGGDWVELAGQKPAPLTEAPAQEKKEAGRKTNGRSVRRTK